jgi:KDO2-lipid IV(A) lauroyltransferase
MHLALNYLDFFRGPHVTDEELAQGWNIENWDEFERAIRSGAGAVVMGAHLGPFDYAGAKLGELGIPLLSPAERLRPERFFQLVTRLRNHHQVRLLPGDDRETLRTLISSLREGNMTLFAIDRWVMGPSEEWPLFGEPARLPTAPFALAARSDAPVFLVVPWRTSLRTFGAIVQLITPERMPPENATVATAPAHAAAADRHRHDREAAIAAMRARVYPALEQIIAAHPEQWVGALSPVWDVAPAQPARATLADAAQSAQAIVAGGAASTQTVSSPNR